ncbi:MAG: family transporter substrate-binding protein [Gammaproteobacteria bacterium]|nr:family transporter substrate-binding protein [Gammaproteobacteria bacterium]
MKRRTNRVVRTALLGAAVWMLGAAGAGPASAVELKALAIMMPEEPTDYGWNQQGFNAAKTVAAKYHLKFMPATGLGYGDVHAELRELADDGASLIIAHAAGYNTAAPEIGAEKHVAVAIVDRPKDSKPGAVADYTLSGHQGAYLAGVLAAKTTQTRAVGIVVSGEPPSWNSQSAAFAQGVHATDAGVRLVYAVIGPAAYSDAAGGRRVTESVIGAGADVIFGQGDGASFGMLQAVETKKSTGGGKVWFIDVIGDKTPVDKGNLLSSVIWNLVPVFSAMIEDMKANRFGTHAYPIQLADDSVQLLHSKHIPDKVWSDVEAVRKQIVEGKLKLEPIFDAAKVRALMSSVATPPS